MLSETQQAVPPRGFRTRKEEIRALFDNNPSAVLGQNDLATRLGIHPDQLTDGLSELVVEDYLILRHDMYQRRR
ncbi:MAG: hypothetical protein WC107_03585 [Patescibacteria group bacterium]